MKTILPFKNGKVKFNLTKPDADGQRYSFWTIKKGKFQCEACKKIFQEGDGILPVYWQNPIPGNFVCIYDRGLLNEIL